LIYRLLYTATAVFVLVAAVSVITHSANDVIGTTTTAPASHYYLTKGTFHGNQALTACATGYHFASFSELNNPSFLTGGYVEIGVHRRNDERWHHSRNA